MSRHDLQPLNESATCITVGWDRPLGTFFAHVYLADDEPQELDIPSLAIGEDFHEVTDPADVIDMVRPYAHLPADLADTLRADERAEGCSEAPLAIVLISTAALDTNEWPCPF
ncbi:hypothetical protein J2S43_001095 [Catenuloplanes nepalensis]|uniref:DUF1902 domain-containing protein n=1 Tax=Catenuloplanes nepalensis TaxID=587533 RepID=A0ABT9MMF4_9ACTN|nr:hypothetical protein [Catenuloplanes nepalensis]MDP9792583.1 hypothetical protein [Catenuloplanes nepalensis]